MSFASTIYQTLSQTYNYTLVVAALCAAYRYRHLDRGMKFICLFIGQSIIAENLAGFAAANYHNNLPVYSISGIAEYSIICLYFNYSLSYYYKRHTGIIAAVAGILFGIINTIAWQPLNRINSNFIFVECLVIVCFALYSIYQRLVTMDIPLIKETHFWVPCILLFYQCTALWNWGCYNYVIKRHAEKMIFLNSSNLLTNVLIYLSLILLLLLYPKMRQTDV